MRCQTHFAACDKHLSRPPNNQPGNSGCRARCDGGSVGGCRKGADGSDGSWTRRTACSYHHSNCTTLAPQPPQVPPRQAPGPASPTSCSISSRSVSRQTWPGKWQGKPRCWSERPARDSRLVTGDHGNKRAGNHVWFKKKTQLCLLSTISELGFYIYIVSFNLSEAKTWVIQVLWWQL